MHIADQTRTPSEPPPKTPSVPPLVQCSIDRGARSLDEYLAEIEHCEVLLALEAAGQNATQAAKLLGISYRSMRYRLENFGIVIEKAV
jgi:transcriptional regulator with PAS, ATPase and Fis domain